MKKRMCSVLLCVCLLIGLLPASVLAEGAATPEVRTGTWGGVDWTFEVTDSVAGTGTLTVEPTKKTDEERRAATFKYSSYTFNPCIDPFTGDLYEVGWWREAVRYSGTTAKAIIEPADLPYSPGKVTKLIIEEGVTGIGSFAAKGMLLTEDSTVVIPSTCAYFGQETFQNVPITELIFATRIENGQEVSDLRCIGPGAFKSLKITSLVLPEGLECIHVWVFLNCTSLEYISWPSTVTDMTGWEHAEYCPGYADPDEVHKSMIFGLTGGATNPSIEAISFSSEEAKTAFMGGADQGFPYVAETGLTVGANLQAAIDAAAMGNGKVTLLKNITVADGSVITIPEGVELDTNGKSLTITGALINCGTISGSGTVTNNGTYAATADADALAFAEASTGVTETAYKITYNLGGGTALGNPGGYYSGTQSITLKNPTREGYTFTGWSGTGLEGNDNLNVTIDFSNARSTVQYREDMFFTAHWRSNNPVAPVPAITMYWPKAEASEGGTVLATPLAVSEGGTINLITKPEEGKKVALVTVTDAEGNLLEITDQGNGRYSFVQPASKVSVKVTFADDLSLADFSDLEADAWYSEAVDYVLEQGYMTGTEAGIFDPAGTMDRAQLITMLWKLEGAPAVVDAVYSDVAADADYANALAWAAKAGIALGHTDGRFAPAETMTLEQLTAFLYRYVQYKAGAEQIVTDLAAAMTWAEESGLLAGPEGLTAPTADAQRVQIAYLLWGVLGK